MVNDHRRKILDVSQLQSRLAERRSAGQVIVHCHGCFDIVHPGHLQYLHFARMQGDVLLVSVTGDSVISKGDQRPYLPQELRAETLAALEFVDYVYVDPHENAVNLLKTIRPDVYVKGKEYETNFHPGFLEERKTVEDYGGRVIYSSGEVVFSSTELLTHLAESPPLTLQRLRPVCRRHQIDRSHLDTILESFTGKRVLVVGDAILDRYVFCDALDVASEAPIVSLARMGQQEFPGGAAIIARHIKAMGAEPVLIAAGADDQPSEWLAERLEADRIAAHLVDYRRSLAEKTRFLVETSKVFKVESGERRPLDSKEEKAVAQLIQDQAGLVDAAIFCDFGYGMITTGLVERAAAVLRDSTRMLAATISGSRAGLLRFRGFDLLCPTEREMRQAVGNFDEGLSSVAWKLMESTQTRQMFVTLGKRGFVTFERQSSRRDSPGWRGRLRSEHLPAFNVNAVDPLGCGDAFLSGATLALTCGSNMMQAGYLGNVAAAIQVATVGNEPVQRAAIRQFLQWRAELAVDADANTPALETG